MVDDVAVLMPENKCNVSIGATCRLAQRFPSAVHPDMMNALEEEVLDYKLASFESEIPSLLDSKECAVTGEHLCLYWHELGKCKTLTGVPRF